jgi:hypothetical protein
MWDYGNQDASIQVSALRRRRVLRQNWERNQTARAMDIEAIQPKRQHSVSEQIALVRHRITTCTNTLYESNGPLKWLRVLSAQRTGRVTRGVLVEINNVPEQDGEFVSGTYLSDTGRFYKFAVTLPWEKDSVPVVEQWIDVTDDVNVSTSIRGKGRSIGALALEILSAS